MRTPLLEVAEVEAGYGNALVLRGVSLAVSSGELVAIIGPNGAGKSTLLRVVYGLLRPEAGSIRHASEDVTGLPPEQLTRRGLNYVPQLANVFPTLSVVENLQVGGVSLPRAERKQAVAEMFEQFPLLAERRRQRAGTLSGGQRKLLAIARALVNDPPLLLADEPTGNLDPDLSLEIMNLLREVNAGGTTVLVATHDRELIRLVGRRTVTLEQGRIAEEVG